MSVITLSDRVSKFFMVAAATWTFGLAFLVMADIVGRGLFNAPVHDHVDDVAPIHRHHRRLTPLFHTHGVEPNRPVTVQLERTSHRPVAACEDIDRLDVELRDMRHLVQKGLSGRIPQIHRHGELLGVHLVGFGEETDGDLGLLVAGSGGQKHTEHGEKKEG